MNRRFGVPALAGPDRLKAGHQTSFAAKSGSWSRCMRKNERGLSMNLQVGRVSPLRAVCAIPSRGAHGVTRPTGSRSPCMRKKRKGALHEPPVWCPGFSRSGPPEGRTPNKFCRKVRFMVPMHVEKIRKRDFDERELVRVSVAAMRRCDID